MLPQIITCTHTYTYICMYACSFENNYICILVNWWTKNKKILYTHIHIYRYEYICIYNNRNTCNRLAMICKIFNCPVSHFAKQWRKQLQKCLQQTKERQTWGAERSETRVQCTCPMKIQALLHSEKTAFKRAIREENALNKYIYLHIYIHVHTYVCTAF